MSTIAEVTLPAPEFALHATLEAVPGANFEIERVAAHESDRLMPFVWTAGEDADPAAIHDALAEDPSVENVTTLAEFDTERLYRMEWVADIRLVLHVLLERGGTVLTAEGRDDEWHLRLLFPEREALSATYDFCEGEELSITVERVYDLDTGRRDEYGLTDAQHETLVTAVERGHFAVPQEATLDDLADDLGVTPQAVSERLHRGQEALVENALIVGRMGG